MALLSTEILGIQLDKVTHDIVFTKGDFATIMGPDGVAQLVKEAVQMIAGEWFYNLDEGIALFKVTGIDPNRVILGNKFKKQRCIAEFNGAILTVEGVVSVASVTVTYNATTRKVDIAYEALSVFGDTIADSLSVGGSK